MSKINLADVAPMYCSACFQQKVDAKHVDFDAAWDGPVLNDYPVDDLVICEACLTTAAKLIGLTSAPRVREERNAAKAEAERLTRELERVRAYSGHLEAAVASRDEDAA